MSCGWNWELRNNPPPPFEAQSMANIIAAASDTVKAVYELLPPLKTNVQEVEKVIVQEVRMIGGTGSARIFVRLAGLSGAVAVSLGAYGSHVFRNKDVDPKLKDTFEIASKYHLLHTLALLGTPLTKRPLVTGSLMTAGMVMFCGSCYYHALTENQTVRKVTPYGGFLLIFAWLSMML